MSQGWYINISIKNLTICSIAAIVNDPTTPIDSQVEDTNNYLDDEDDADRADKTVKKGCGNNCLIVSL